MHVFVVVQTQFEGLTGSVRFDEKGRRAEFTLDLIELTVDGIEKVHTVK